MIRIGKETKLSSKEVMDRAVAFFGPGGLGLRIEARAPFLTRFVGGGGYVSVQTSEGSESGKLEVDVEGREWESQIKQFLGRI